MVCYGLFIYNLWQQKHFGLSINKTNTTLKKQVESEGSREHYIYYLKVESGRNNRVGVELDFGMMGNLGLCNRAREPEA